MKIDIAESVRTIFEYSGTDGYRAQGVSDLRWKQMNHYKLALIHVLVTVSSKTVSRKELFEAVNQFWSFWSGNLD